MNFLRSSLHVCKYYSTKNSVSIHNIYTQIDFEKESKSLLSFYIIFIYIYIVTVALEKCHFNLCVWLYVIAALTINYLET